MGSDQHLGTVLDKVLEGGNRGADAGVIGDDAVLQRDVQVAAHEHNLAFEISLLQVPDGLLLGLNLERGPGSFDGRLSLNRGLGEESLGGERGGGGGEGGHC